MAENPETPEATAMENQAQDATLDVAVKGMRGKVVLWTILAAAGIAAVTVFVLWFFVQESFVVPEFEKGWIVSRVEGSNVASTDPSIASDGKGIMLYLVLYGHDKVEDEYYYYMRPPGEEEGFPRLFIEGEEIPPDRIRRFDLENVDSMVVWYKIELSPSVCFSKPGDTEDFAERVFWSKSNLHHMGDRWWAVADVRPDLYRTYLERDVRLFAQKYLYDFLGTNHFVAKIHVYHSEEDEVYARLETVGASAETNGEMPPGAHRITILPHTNSLAGAYYAYLNMFAYETEHGPASQRARESAKSIRGGDSRSVLIGALNLILGFEVSYDEPEFLEAVAEKLYSGVFVDDDFFRTRDNPTEAILFGEDGLRPGDILVAGDRYMVLVGPDERLKESRLVPLTSDGVVFDAYNDIVMMRKLDFITPDQSLEIWRLLPPDEAREAED